jgi:hypothetical protein
MVMVASTLECQRWNACDECRKAGGKLRSRKSTLHEQSRDEDVPSSHALKLSPKTQTQTQTSLLRQLNLEWSKKVRFDT